MRTSNEAETPAGHTGKGSFSEFLHAWRYFLWLLGVILLVVLIFAEENWRGESAWTEYKKQMAANGEPVEFAAVIPPKVPEEENFALVPFLAPLFDFLLGSPNGTGMKPVGNVNSFAAGYDAASRELKLPKAARFSSWLRPATDLRDWYLAFKVSQEKSDQNKAVAARASGQGYRLQSATNGPQKAAGLSLTNYTIPEAATGILDMLSDTEGIFDQLQTASRTRYCRFNLNYEQDDPAEILLPHLSVVKHLCQVLELRACAELALSQPDKAFQDVRLSLYLAHVFHDEPFVISQLVGMSCLSIALQPLAEGINQWSDQQLRTLQGQLGEFDFCLDASRTLKAERVWTSRIIDYVSAAPNKVRLMDGFFSGQQQTGIAFSEILMGISPAGWFDLEKVNSCQLTDTLVTPTIDVKARRIDPGWSHKMEQGIANLNAESISGSYFRHRFFSRLLMPSSSAIAKRVAFAQAGVDCALIACGVELCRRENGRLPETLEVLEPRFVRKIPHDIITGQSLKYHIGHDGRYSLYSVGWNGVDDGGAIGTADRGEVASSSQGDWIWRLP